jgi:hypothetical protein
MQQVIVWNNQGVRNERIDLCCWKALSNLCKHLGYVAITVDGRA